MSPPDTKQRILAAAERLFAREGFHCTSLRQITGAAQVNLAAVNYHFGSKEALLEAVLDRRLEPLNRLRRERLEAVRQAARQRGSRPQVAETLRAFIEPTMALCRPGSGAEDFVVLVGRGLAEPGGAVGELFLAKMRDLFELLFAILCEALPQLPAERVFWRLQFALGAMAHSLRWAGAFPELPEPLRPTEDSAELTEQLMEFILAGMEVPCA